MFVVVNAAAVSIIHTLQIYLFQHKFVYVLNKKLNKNLKTTKKLKENK